MKNNIVFTALLSLVIGSTITAATNNSFIETLAQQEARIGFNLIRNLADKDFEFSKLTSEDQEKIEQLINVGIVILCCNMKAKEK